ncbi:MAG: replicative DNA helicase [Candidatus Tritonobacter lacicola]|nr:replicative DNA helicase [Candidatus Tritonobacter lacicola]
MKDDRFKGDRLPPHNTQAEISVLGSMLLDNDAIVMAIELRIIAESFYKPYHRIIFRAILDLYERNEAVDIVTLTNRLRDMDQLEAVGGPVYITELINTVPSAANIEHYARIVNDKAILRSLISTAGNIIANSYEDPDAVADLLDRAEQMVFDISQRKVEGGFQRVGDGLIKNAIETAEMIYQQGGLLSGISSGFKDLDNMTSGFQPSDLIILAARPSMGKTAIALNIAEHLGVEEKIPVGIFSLEMSKQALVMRLLCSHARVSSHRVRMGFISEKYDFPRLVSSAGKLAQAPIYIDDTAGLSAMEMRAKARRLVSKEKVRFIILDYLQLMRPAGIRRLQNREQEVAEMSRSIKALARELNIPIMILSQLNRSPEARADHKPQISDLRESGSLEQDADLVLLLFREEVYDRDDQDLKGRADLKIGKQRNGPIGTIKLSFIEEYTKFESAAAREEQESFEEEAAPF